MSRLPAALWVLGLTGLILKSLSWTVTLRLDNSDILRTCDGVRGGPRVIQRSGHRRHASGVQRGAMVHENVNVWIQLHLDISGPLAQQDNYRAHVTHYRVHSDHH